MQIQVFTVTIPHAVLHLTFNGLQHPECNAIASAFIEASDKHVSPAVLQWIAIAFVTGIAVFARDKMQHLMSAR